MKDLRTYLEDLLATPMNTTGLGSVTVPTDTTPGSGDLPYGCFAKNDIKKQLKKRKKKKIN